MLASGMERSGAARRWRAALRSPIRKIPCGLDPFGALSKTRYLYRTILYTYLPALVLALPLVAVRKSRLRAARSGSCTASKLCEVGTIDAPRIRL